MKKQVRYRSYTKHIENGPHILVAWMQKKCIKCQRFLSKKQKKFCIKCEYKADLERTNIWRKGHPDKIKEYRINEKKKYSISQLF